MARINKIVVNQVDARLTSDAREPNTYAYDANGILVRHDNDRVAKPVVGPGVLYGANNDSADQSGLNTVKLIPNEDINTDQYLVVEPTGPNHIHLRAGGTVDASNADLILGGENTHVYISDSNDQVTLKGSGGQFLNDPTDPINQIATLGSIEASHGAFDFVSDTMEVRDSAMKLKAYGADEVTLRGEVEFNPGDDYGIFRVYDDQDSVAYTTSDWAAVIWSVTEETSSLLTLTGASGIYNYLNTSLRPFNRAVLINGTYRGNFVSWAGDGTTVSIALLDLAQVPDTTVTTLDIYSSYASTISLDYDTNEMNFAAQGLNINMTTTGNRDISLTSADEIRITATGNDLIQRSGDDILFSSNYGTSNKNWSMNSEGRFVLPAEGYIENVVDGSGDGSGYNTIKIVPDATRETFDQYLIIDPTDPDHIHIRAGGGQDNSDGVLFLGGERTHVQVSDTLGQVYVTSKVPDTTNTYENISGDEPTVLAVSGNLSSIDPYGNFSVDVDGTLYQIDGVNYISGSNVTEITASPATFVLGTSYTIHESNGQNYWAFANNGHLTGPGEDGALILGGELLTDDMNMSIRSTTQSVVLNGQLGEFLGSSDDASSQIATIGDVETAQGAGANGEVTRWSPNFEATGLTFTGSGATYPTYNSHYVKNGRMVSFWIEIDLATVTNFGTGQYLTALPFDPLTGTMNHFQAWCLVDETANPDNTGHAILQADHLADTSVLDLHYLKQSGGANSPIMEAQFKQGSPVTLTTATHVYINGTYITAE